MQQLRSHFFALAAIIALTPACASALAQTTAPAPAPAPAPTPAPAPAATPAVATPMAAPADARVYFISPTNGARIRGPIIVRFGLRNMGVARAGDKAPNTGHHHLLVDARENFSVNEPLPTDKNHLHFGGGQTETRLDLPPGRHTLQLVLGDFEHRPFNPVVASEKIQITVLSPRPRAKRQRARRW